MLDLKEITFQRGEDGNLIPQEVELKLEGKPKVRVKPLSRGRLQEIYAMANSENKEEKAKADNEILLSGLVEPAINEETLKDLKPQFATAITTAILSISLGIDSSEIENQIQTVVETELKKN